MKKYEIPFNFDLNFLDFLQENIDRNWVEFLFLSPFKEDSQNARSHVEGVKKQWGTYNVPNSRKEYSMYINEIQKRGFKTAVLFQEPEFNKKNTMDYYLNMGIDTFVVNNDSFALTLKEINSKITTIASITKTLSAKDLWEKDLTMYDKIVLHFPFNRALSKLKQLPAKYKYTILLNSYCMYNCTNAKKHWNSSPEEAKNVVCTKGNNKDDLIYIPPEYVNLFEPYVDSFKIQGREYPTSVLSDEIYCYYKGFHNPLAGAIYNRVSPYNSLDYFDKGKDNAFVNYDKVIPELTLENKFTFKSPA